MKRILKVMLLFLATNNYSLASSPSIIKLDEQFMILAPEKTDIGYVYSASLNGEDYKTTLTAKDPDGLTWLDSHGCITKQLVQFSFPVLWRNCEPFVDGTATVEYGGKIWPLKIGRKFYFKADFNDRIMVRECEVTGTYQINLNLSEFNTLKVVCEDLWNKLEWYLNIDDGQTIIHTHTNSYYNLDLRYTIRKKSE